jgi:hypothetical protein
MYQDWIMIRKVSIYIFTLVVLAACVPHAQPASTPILNPAIALTLTAMPETLDSLSLDFITSKSCHMPCLLGITPGETTKREAQEILSKIEVPKDCRPLDREIPCADIDYDNNNRVESVEFFPKALPLGLVIEKFGPPDTVLVVSNGEIIAADLYFHELGMVIGLPGMPSEDSISIIKEKYVIEPYIEVTNVHSIARDWYEQIKYDGNRIWKGFGIYLEVDPGEFTFPE